MLTGKTRIIGKNLINRANLTNIVSLVAPLQNYPGLMLNTSQYNNVDPLGVVRGADGVWDRGAYEYNPASTTGGTTTGKTTGVAYSNTNENSTSRINIAIGMIAALIGFFVL